MGKTVYISLLLNHLVRSHDHADVHSNAVRPDLDVGKCYITLYIVTDN